MPILSDFNIPETVDVIDDVPEKFRSLYVEKDGKHVFQDPAVLVRSLTNAKRERDGLKGEAASAAAWKKLGKSPDEIEALLAKQAEAEEARALKAGEFDKIKAQIIEKHAGELEAERAKLTKKDRAIERFLVDAAATRAIAEAKGSAGLLLPHVRASVKVVEEGDEYTVRIVDAKGDPRVNAKGDYLSIADLVAEMRESEIYGRAFEATGAGGSGAPSNGKPAGGGRSMPAAEFNRRSPKERAQLMAQPGFHLT